jgi:hypothetical protein
MGSSIGGKDGARWPGWRRGEEGGSLSRGEMGILSKESSRVYKLLEQLDQVGEQTKDAQPLSHVFINMLLYPLLRLCFLVCRDRGFFIW